MFKLVKCEDCFVKIYADDTDQYNYISPKDVSSKSPGARPGMKVYPATRYKLTCAKSDYRDWQSSTDLFGLKRIFKQMGINFKYARIEIAAWHKHEIFWLSDILEHIKTFDSLIIVDENAEEITEVNKAYQKTLAKRNAAKAITDIVRPTLETELRREFTDEYIKSSCYRNGMTTNRINQLLKELETEIAQCNCQYNMVNLAKKIVKENKCKFKGTEIDGTVQVTFRIPVIYDKKIVAGDELLGE